MVSKTLELRKVITRLLKETNVEVFYENAKDTAKYPYIVYNLDNVNFENIHRDDVILTIDIWDRNTSSSNIETLADHIEGIFNNTNKPTDKVLPTFYLDSRRSLPDEDKQIRRREIRALIKNYYIGG